MRLQRNSFWAEGSSRSMIVRINQFDVFLAEQYAGWPETGLQGPLAAPWPADTNAFEILILDQDEQRQPLSRPFRQSQLRQLLPQVIEALVEPNEKLVARLDGPVEPDQLLPAFNYLTDARGAGRFGIAAATKLDLAPGYNGTGGVRMELSTTALTKLCNEQALGLERSVRLRIFALPEALVNPFLDISEVDDERWPEILPQAG